MAPVYSTLAASPSETVVPSTEQANTDFDVSILDESDIDNIPRNAYVKELADKSLLNILQPKCVKKPTVNQLWHACHGRFMPVLIHFDKSTQNTKGKYSLMLSCKYQNNGCSRKQHSVS
jgi:hypothetical protein